jgi:hypothetical protein
MSDNEKFALVSKLPVQTPTFRMNLDFPQNQLSSLQNLLVPFVKMNGLIAI